LEISGYLEKSSARKTKAGFETMEYELTARAYLALAFESITLENLLKQINKDVALDILAAIISLL